MGNAECRVENVGAISVPELTICKLPSSVVSC